MLSKEERKEVVRKFKERKPLLGVFAVRCTATGRVWAGASRNLDTTKNASCRNGSYHDQAFQAEWNANGEPMFQYEVLEKLDGDVLPLGIGDLLKEKRNCWIAQLFAQRCQQISQVRDGVGDERSKTTAAQSSGP